VPSLIGLGMTHDWQPGTHPSTSLRAGRAGLASVVAARLCRSRATGLQARNNGHPFAQPNAPRKRDKEDDEELERPSRAEILLDRLQIIEKEDATERAASVGTPTPPPPRPAASPAVKTESGIVDKLEACADSGNKKPTSVIPRKNAAISACLWRLPHSSRGTCIVPGVTR